VVLHEAVSLDRWVAILAVVSGAAVVSWTPASGAAGPIGIGVLYAFAAALGYGLQPLIVKVGLEEATAPLAAAFIGSIAALMSTLVVENRASLRGMRLDAAFGWFVLAGVFQAVGITSLTFALAGGDVSLVYTLTASAPLVTLVIAAVALRGIETITWRLVIGTIAVIAGVIYL
jgi:drug/metabolite transporter (DMT)-like permease